MEAAAAPMWDELQAYEELLYWDSLIQQGHRLLPEDFDRYHESAQCVITNAQNVAFKAGRESRS